MPAVGNLEFCLVLGRFLHDLLPVKALGTKSLMTFMCVDMNHSYISK